MRHFAESSWQGEAEDTSTKSENTSAEVEALKDEGCQKHQLFTPGHVTSSRKPRNVWFDASLGGLYYYTLRTTMRS